MDYGPPKAKTEEDRHTHKEKGPSRRRRELSTLSGSGASQGEGKGGRKTPAIKGSISARGKQRATGSSLGVKSDHGEGIIRHSGTAQHTRKRNQVNTRQTAHGLKKLKEALLESGSRL